MFNISPQLQSRIKSFVWRVGMMGAAAIVAIMLDNLKLLQLSTTETAVVGLLLGEVSKYLNNLTKQEDLQGSTFEG